MIKFLSDKIQDLISGVALMIFPHSGVEQTSKILDAIDGEELEDREEVQQISGQDERANKDKRAFFERALGSGIAALYLDPRVNGVVVPEKFAGYNALVLNYSYKYMVSDFAFDDHFVIASLSFGGFPFRCVVPWAAVLAIESRSENLICSFQTAEDNPKIFETGSMAEREVNEEKTFSTKNGKTRLSLLKGGKE